MSIIIRLQNLPLSARSGDIRNFFGGLRIPDGGVHILGGDKGNAFIAFMSDEDARLAMRKDGAKIKDSRVKLFLSSRMEMQHEVEKITKNNLVEASSYKIPNETRTSGADFIRSRSTERRRGSYSRSPNKSDDWNYNKSRTINEYERSKSPIIYNSRSSLRYRSRSPRRSKSPMRSFPSQKLTSLKSRKIIQRKRSISPRAHHFPYAHYPHQIEGANDSLSPPVCEISEYHNPETLFPSQNKLQSELEKRITDELEKSFAFRKSLGINEHQEYSIPTSNISIREKISHRTEDSYLQDYMFTPYASTSSNAHHFEDDKFKQVDRNQQGNLIAYHSENLAMGEKVKQNVSDSFYITMSGLEPVWNFREVQIILKGIFAPQYNIRWEKVDGFKTGTIFLKLTNKEDFDNVVQKAVFYFKGKKIVVSECPISVVHKYFRLSFDTRNEHYTRQDYDLCYLLKGLPFSCTYDDIINFFQGFEVADILIFYGEDGRATGTGFISFTNWNDFGAAMIQNGKKIGRRYIELLPSTKKEMSEAKISQPGGSFVPYSTILSEKKLPSTRRPLCAKLTGLPFNATTNKISSFFSESGLKPDAIHLTLNKKKMSDGKAFVEFTNFLDFDLALKFHGKLLDNNVINVKQILYDEMVKILDSQRAKHHFEIPDHTSGVSNEPEKVPYLWEPPDEEQEKIDCSSISARDHKVVISSYPNNKVVGDFANSVGQFNVKKQTSINPPLNETFHCTKKYEENIKLSRLSPENEAALLDFLNKDRKPSPDEINNSKKYFKSRSKDNSRNRNERDSKHSDNLSYDNEPHHRSPIQSDSLNFESVRRNKEDKSKACIVQLSNVDVSAESHALLNFLKGFDFYEETLIRGYTADGDPTPDVRVTFHNRREAERAKKLLNKRYLQGKKVDIFIV